jgi:hypothetical protein
MDNYIYVNGRKRYLSDEEANHLESVYFKNEFDRQSDGLFYFIDIDGEVTEEGDCNSTFEDSLYAVGNYCTNEAMMVQQSYREILRRLLWRYTMQHDGDKIELTRDEAVFIICFSDNEFSVKCLAAGETEQVPFLSIVFIDRVTALGAIREVVVPFINQHPDFDWRVM